MRVVDVSDVFQVLRRRRLDASGLIGVLSPGRIGPGRVWGLVWGFVSGLAAGFSFLPPSAGFSVFGSGILVVGLQFGSPPPRSLRLSRFSRRRSGGSRLHRLIAKPNSFGLVN